MTGYNDSKRRSSQRYRNKLYSTRDLAMSLMGFIDSIDQIIPSVIKEGFENRLPKDQKKVYNEMKSSLKRQAQDQFQNEWQ